jgi:hypothetical protein
MPEIFSKKWLLTDKTLNSLLTASTVPYTSRNITLSQAYTNFTHLIFESFSSKGIIIVSHISLAETTVEDTTTVIKSSSFTATRSLSVKGYFLLKISGCQ